jgi:bifunctional non-homologous end joining protein LigD
MRLRLVGEPFDNPDFLYEWKADGSEDWLTLRMATAAHLPQSEKPAVRGSLRCPRQTTREEFDLRRRDSVPRQNGVSQFNWLWSGRRANQTILYVFDLLWINNADLRGEPLVKRKARLRELVRRSVCPRLLYAQHVENGGKELFSEICRCDLEGIVAKRKMGMYREDRPDWLKIKNRTYSQAEGRHELLTRARKKD